MTLFTPPFTIFHDNGQWFLLSCLDLNTGWIDVNKFMFYSRSLSDKVQAPTNTIIAQCDCSSGSQSINAYNNIKRLGDNAITTRETEAVQVCHGSAKWGWWIWTHPSNRIIWHIYYAPNPLLEDERHVKKFCDRFRLPYDKINELSAQCIASNLFNRWMSYDAVGPQPTPLEFLVLGTPTEVFRMWMDFQWC